MIGITLWKIELLTELSIQFHTLAHGASGVPEAYIRALWGSGPSPKRPAILMTVSESREATRDEFR
jgi:hypothetical protein